LDAQSSKEVNEIGRSRGASRT